MYRIWTWLLLVCGISNSVEAVDGPVFLKRACLAPDSTVTLSWIKSPDPCNSFTKYYIYGRESNLVVFQAIDSVFIHSVEGYVFKLPAIKKTWEFYVSTSNPCGTSDTMNSAIIKIDDVQPSPTLLDSVSVDFITQTVIMGWQKNPTGDLAAYRIYQVVGTNNIEIKDTSSLIFRHSAEATNTPLSYSIAAVDSCNNPSAIGAPHKTIFLTNKIDTCRKEITLNWDAYSGWGVENYTLYGDTNNSGDYVEIAKLNSSTLSYTYSYRTGYTYKFFIRASKSGSGITSTSNRTERFTRPTILPAFNYLSLVTVENNADIRIKWIKDLPAEISYFYILRATDSVNFVVIDSANVIDGQINYEYLDLDADPTSRVYYYRIDAYNVCRRILMKSNVSQNILLKIEYGGTSNYLYWTNYHSWPTNIESYRIWRGVSFGTTFNWDEIFVSDGIANNFLDNNIPSNMDDSGTCYYVRAHENAGNPFGTQELSISNEVCVIYEASIFFPNAFHPNGVNKAFEPIGKFINWDLSKIEIYSRWGEKVFESKGSNYIWDGTFPTGGDCPTGLYYYKAFIKGKKGNVFNESGTITLIR